MSEKNDDFPFQKKEGVVVRRGRMAGWMICDFTSFITVFQSYQDDVWMIMKGCVQWNSVTAERISP